MEMEENLIALGVILIFVVVVLVKTAVVVPQRSEFVVERLGKYRTTLSAGFHILMPFLDKVAYRRNLKEQPIDTPAQTCITADNVTLEVDGILYLQVVDAKMTAYGIEDYRYAAAQLAQTSLRSAIGQDHPRQRLRGPGDPQRARWCRLSMRRLPTGVSKFYDMKSRT
jgi:regulator of protease activity HflC (stomatin/prohibitin superfamily)